MPQASPKPKLDLHRLHKAEYAASRRPVLLDVSPALYMAIEGQGSPDGETFAESVAALYAVAYSLKAANKATGRDYAVAKLEGLWWSDDDSDSFLEQPRHTWKWQLMLRVPDFVAAEGLESAKEKVANKQKLVGEVSLLPLHERTCVQMLHVGPFAEETGTLVQMWAFCGEKGYRLHGRHHEIYLSDPRRVSPEKLKTILRHPVQRQPE